MPPTIFHGLHETPAPKLGKGIAGLPMCGHPRGCFFLSTCRVRELDDPMSSRGVKGSFQVGRALQRTGRSFSSIRTCSWMLGTFSCSSSSSPILVLGGEGRAGTWRRRGACTLWKRCLALCMPRTWVSTRRILDRDGYHVVQSLRVTYSRVVHGAAASAGGEFEWY